MKKINKKNKKLKKYTVKVYVEKMFQQDFYAEDGEQALRMANRSKQSEWKMDDDDYDFGLYKNAWEIVGDDGFSYDGIGNKEDFFDIEEENNDRK